MAHQSDPNDPYRAGMTDDEIRRQARLNNLDNEVQADPALGEGPASTAKVAMFAIVIAVVLGAVFYGLNNTSVNEAGKTPSGQTAQTQPGTTTGAAPARPSTTSPAPSSTDMNKTTTPPADNAPSGKQ